MAGAGDNDKRNGVTVPQIRDWECPVCGGPRYSSFPLMVDYRTASRCYQCMTCSAMFADPLLFRAKSVATVVSGRFRRRD